MKIRNGFVSNSSSSSFIVAGFKVRKEDLKLTDEQRELLWETNYMVLAHEEDGAPKGYIIVGKEIAGGEYGLDYTENSIKSLKEFTDTVTKEVAAKLGKKTLPKAMKGIFTGTRCC